MTRGPNGHFVYFQYSSLLVKYRNNEFSCQAIYWGPCGGFLPAEFLGRVQSQAEKRRKAARKREMYDHHSDPVPQPQLWLMEDFLSLVKGRK